MLTVNRFPALLTLLLVSLGALAAAPSTQAQFKIPGLKIPGLPQPKMPDLNLPGPEMLTKQEEGQHPPGAVGAAADFAGSPPASARRRGRDHCRPADDAN